jgi:hypothetical protein
MHLHVPHPWKERREAEQAAGIAQIHADMAAMEGPVGELARLYDRLRDAAATPDSGISYRGENHP